METDEQMDVVEEEQTKVKKGKRESLPKDACKDCKHEKRFHIDPENHETIKDSWCTKSGCACKHYQGE